jgi:hypothetical protein
MKQLDIHRDSWLEAALDDPDESRAFARVRISVGEANLTRNLSARGGGTSDAINVSLLPLAQAIARNWWPLLYEPFRSGGGDAFRARHRLDVPMHGYIFPKIALCSGGNDTLLTAWVQSPQEHSRIEFLTPASIGPEVLARDQVEDTLIDMLEAVMDRLDVKGPAYQDLATAWGRIQTSIGDSDEFAYCKVAGKLGVDPYDPATPDLTAFTSQVPDSVFEDISDVAFIEELLPTTNWLASVKEVCHRAPQVDISAFGVFPDDQLHTFAWEVGRHAADVLRQNTGAGADTESPRKHLEEVFGSILLRQSASFSEAPASIAALISRNDTLASIATVARSAREQRFKVCTAAYIGWAGISGEDRLATAAFTRHQQASRAFAAELLAPRNYLQGRAPTHGFTSDQIESIAGELICPNETVVWQAHHAGIPLRGVELPPPQYPTIV